MIWGEDAGIWTGNGDFRAAGTSTRLQRSGVRDAILSIFSSLKSVFHEMTKIVDRYKIAVSTEISIAGSKDMASAFNSAYSGHLQRVRSRQESTNISRKIRWRLHDKKVVDELMNNIRSFNDSLLDLVPVGESIGKPQTGDSGTTVSRDGGPTTLSDIDEESGVTGSLHSSVAHRLPLRLESASRTTSVSQQDAYETSGHPPHQA